MLQRAVDRFVTHRLRSPSVACANPLGTRQSMFDQTRVHMRYSYLALAVLVTATAVQAQDADRSVKGGIQVAGWKGRVDRRPMSQGKTVDDSKVVADGKGLRLSVGPAGNFWNPANTASGDFTVKAMFDELKMAASHPHSFGIFIGGQDLESENRDAHVLHRVRHGEVLDQDLPWRR
jgi:hypothetical protein